MPSRWHRSANKNADVWIMGVLNCTPDSFSDGGSYSGTEAAVQHGLKMWQDGADIIDVGGESTRPGSESVSVEEELRRVVPVVKRLADHGCAVSIDTMKAEVMAVCAAAGAAMINDVSALGFDENSAEVAADSGLDVCLMHMQGSPASMQNSPVYDDVVDEVSAFFEQRIAIAQQAGIKESSILLDPGIGFGKRLQDNLELIRSLSVFKQRFDMPLLLGVSRKSFLGQLTGAAVHDREIETAVAGAIGIAHGADLLRVHDVATQKRAIQVAGALG